MNQLHVMTQDDQPYMSERKCCERCAYAYWVWDEDDSYVTEHYNYTKEIAKDNNLIRCCDNKKVLTGSNIKQLD